MVFNDAHRTDFHIPEGRYYLADAGFASSDALLVPYRNVRYHLSEWKHGNKAPCNAKELFNLRHASARNVIERIFGILKRRFRILLLPPDYDMTIQALIPPALAALHNFIRQYDPEEINAYEGEVADPQLNYQDQDHPGVLVTGPATSDETHRANERRDRIAGEMWEQYQDYLQHR